MASSTYTAADITVLEGLEPVRKRPGMYIGGVDSRGLHHLVWEIVDNAVDEVINGYATRIDVRLFADGREVEISDNGRGIPVDVHPKYKKPALELILTTLHAGGKFEQGNYVHAGGLHGVGSSVVCGLSSEMTVHVRRDGNEWMQTYGQGKATSKLTKVSTEKVRGSGTTVRFRPDAEIFGKLSFDADEIRDRLEAKTYLHRGLRVVFVDETQKPAVREEFAHDGGLADYLLKVVAERAKTPTHASGFVLVRDAEPRLELSLQWTESTDEHFRSWVNGIPTSSGGTQESGLKAGIVKAVRNHLATHALLPKGVNPSAEDIREGLVTLLSVYVLEP
ncbi:MAG TPA: ATP-binding protein, partial [Thermoanaerobaculia bacterium]|nr:ATP-binding protein [Thermoanaerobaculia bacterium]